ncbi:MAG TPA: DoxX family protein [Candidatus Limnocylindrales bacterium]|nr:DoxX family protein [Candidatus Limnocylindrales bacterium]
MADRAGSRWSDLALSILRIVVGFLFFCHGAQKILGWFVEPGSQRMALAFPQIPWIAGILELVGGPLIMLGLLTRPVAFILSGQMAFAYFMAHAPKGPIPLMNHGELAALYSFVFLFFAAQGGGSYGIDGLLRRGRRQ